MADKRITDLPELVQADSGDFIPIVDSSMNVTKRVAAEKVLPNGSVVAPLIPDGSVSPEKRSGGFYAAQITFSAGTGVKSLTGFGFRPKMIQVTIGVSSGATDFQASGTAVDGSPIVQNFSASSSGTGSFRTIYGTNGTFVATSGAANIYHGSVTSFDSDGVTVNVTTDAGANFRIWNVTAWG
ncbi:hypothetical protein G6024_14670 [Dietzia maris]|nr:hypothetical protein [Dietzia maris]MBB0998314.1 hypothetical protein [Dietzia maris]